MPRRCAIIFLFLIVVQDVARPDDALYRFEGDILPYDPVAGWLVFAVCDVDCTEIVANGHFILEWAADGRDTVNYTLRIADSPELLPPTLWVEWRFRSNNPIRPPGFYSCDARFLVSYKAISENLWITGDAIVSLGADYFVLDLPIDEFRTYRFESPDGNHVRISVDGFTFLVDEDFVGSTNRTLQFGGDGGCVLMEEPTRNEWDYIRYGTIGEGEAIVASDPPAGIVETSDHPNLDRFSVTFDQPNYVYIDDVTVDVSGGTAPSVIKTRRLDNGPSETVEIVLDRPLAVDVATRFTFNTGGSPNTVEYTLVQSGACCQGDGACTESNEPTCADVSGVFVPDASCDTPVACCADDGSCAEVDPICCATKWHRSLTVAARIITPLDPPWARGEALCEGDADGDGLDGACGDGCPHDPAKNSAGLCGCGVPDVDTDADTIPDCHDQCLGEDDRVDDNQNSIPDCLKQQAIPTATAWGLVVLALSLAIAAKIRFLPSPTKRPFVVRDEIDANPSDT